jgi:methionyl-tRNA formyltransferase
MNRTLIITDSLITLEIAKTLQNEFGKIDIRKSLNSSLKGLQEIDVNDKKLNLGTRYSLILSIHCKQIFPEFLIKTTKCINVHPGYNPYNRGYFPHIFSIINNKPCGVTIHEMDKRIDNGPIIIQKKCNIKQDDTSFTAYQKIISLEKELLIKYYPKLRDGSYSLKCNTDKGNFNSISNFTSILELKMNEKKKVGDTINMLRALSHTGYNNSYFIDDSGRKIYVELKLKREI